MNGLSSIGFDTFVRSSMFLAAAAVAMAIALRLLRPKSPIAHRLAWASVLVCGVLVLHISLEIPWYDPPATSSAAVAEALPALPAGRTLAAEAEPGNGPAPTVIEPRRQIGWRTVFASVWVIGMAIAVSLSAFSYACLLLSVRRATAAPHGWRGQWRRLLRSEGVRADIPLLVHPRLGPMLCRMPRRFVVVVPAGLWAEFTAQERQAILRHELAHFQRGDVWTSLAARSIALPHWFNPCAWWAVRKFEEGGEWACDAKLLSDPHQIPSFARAMLAMSEPVPNRVCTSAARGSSLSVRLKRLLSFQSPEDSVMKRALLCGVLVCLVAGGMFRVHLVARAQEEERAPVSRQRTEQQIAAFTKRVAGGDRLKEFKAALATPAGKVVLRDRISFYEEQLRNESRDDALPSYFEKRFELTDGEYRLRAGQERYREELLSTVSAFNEDVEKIAAALRGVSQEIDGKTEADRLLVRFMNHEAAPAMLYIQELRERLRPDVGLVEKLLGQIFVANEDGKYIVRPGRRSEAAEYLKQVQVIRKSVKPIRAELAEWSKELVAKDDFHRRVKKALGEPLFASFIAAELIGEGGGDISRKIQQFFDELGDIAVDTADGLEIVEAGEREEIERALKKYQQTVRISRKLSKALKSFAAKIDDQSELEKGWRDALSTELAIVRIGGEYEYADADADAIIRELLGEVLEDKGDNKKAVAAGRAEEVTRFVREMFRQFRSVRSRARSIDETAENLSDTDLSAALKTMGGKFAVLHSIQQELKAKQVDGFSVWLREHFVDTDNGWALRDGADQMIKEFLAEVSEVNAELKKDDF